MTKQEFIEELHAVIVKDMIKDVNKMLGQVKTAFLSTSLLLRLQIKFVVVEDEYASLPKAPKLEDLDNVFRSYTMFDNPDIVMLEVHYDSKKTLKRLLKLATKHSDYFAVHYIKHLHGALLKVNSKAYIQSTMKDVATKSNPFTIAQIATDRLLSKLALDTLNAADIDTRQYAVLFETADSTDIKEILDQVSTDFEDLTITKIPKYIRKLRVKPIEHINEILEAVSFNEQGQGSYGYSKGADKESVIVDLAISLNHSISSSCKGTAVGNLISTSFKSNKIDALWFEKLNRTLVGSILEKSHDGYSSWTNMSKTKRHLYPSPIRISNDKKLSLYVSIDHSASVSTADLQKILSIFEQHSHLISRVVIMHHTSVVIQKYTLTDSYDNIIDHPEFKDAFATRHGNGGTSHLDVINRIAKDVKKHHIDPSEVIWLSFSDNYSDLEDVCMSQYKVLQPMDKYFIRDNKGRDVKLNTIPGKSWNIVTP